MLANALLTFIMISVTTMFLVVLGEAIAASYPNTKFNKWWRRYMIYEEK